MPLFVLTLLIWRVKLVRDTWRPYLFLPTSNHCLFKLSPDGRWLAVTHDRFIELVDLSSGQRFPLPNYAQPEGFSPDSSKLLLGPWPPWLSAIDVTTRKEMNYLGHSRPGALKAFQFKNLAYVSDRGDIRLFCFDGLYRWTTSGSFSRIPIQTPTGRIPATESSNRPRPSGGVAYRLDFAGATAAKDGKVIVACFADCRYYGGASFLYVMDASSAKVLRRIYLGSFGQGVHDIQLSHDGRLGGILASVFDLTNGKQLWNGKSAILGFTPDGKFALTGDPGAREMLRVCEARAGQLVREVGPLPLDGGAIAVMPDGKYAICAGKDNGLFRIRVQ